MASTPIPAAAETPASSNADALVKEVSEFLDQCNARYYFNSRWDNVLNVSGILLSVAIIAAGAFALSKTTTVLGGLVAAIVTAQRAFPFGSRAQFYRVLIGQTTNLLTDIRMELPLSAAAANLKSLRLDFAQQLPRGSSFRSDSTEQQPAGVGVGGPKT